MAARSAVVVGAGIMGTSTAFWLHQRGWEVTLLDAAQVPNPDGSSGGIHRLIRTTYGPQRGYTRMVTEAYPAWDEVQELVGRKLLTHTGMLAVDTDAETFGATAGTFAADTREVFDELGLPHRLLDHDELQEAYPQFRVPGDATALYTDDAHFIRARETVDVLASWLRDRGTTVRANAPVTRVDADAGTVDLVSGERVDADRVVVAAGAWTRDLLDEEAAELTPSRQVVIDLGVPDRLRAAWADGPAFVLPPAYGIPPRDELPLKIGDHAFSLTGHPDDDREPGENEVRAVLEVAGEALVDIEDYEVLDARTCYYTFHDEERFVVEPRGERGALLAGFSGHGFKMGPVVGQHVAAALDDDADWDEVTAWAAGRDTGAGT